MNKRIALAIVAGAFCVVQPAHAEIDASPAHNAHVPIVYGRDDVCSGELIAPNIVQTAAHCVASDPAYAYIVRSGRTQRKAYAFIDPAWTPPETSDIAELALRRPVKLHPLCEAQPQFELQALSFGHGMTHWSATGQSGNNTFALHVASVMLHSAGYVPTQFDSTPEIFGGSLGEGDSGGPVMQNGNVVGINDAAMMTPGSPSYYTALDAWALSWAHC